MKFTYDDVLIVPKFSSVGSRKNVSLESFGLGLPIMSSNMDSITEEEMATSMFQNGAIGCLHRFCSIERNVEMFFHSPVETFVSIGLGDEELKRAEALKIAGATNFIIDVAHGAQKSVVEQVESLNYFLDIDDKLVVGNFASFESAKIFLEKTDMFPLRASALKIGIGSGRICKTRTQTGVGYPQLSAILEIANLKKDYGVKLIADGGIRTGGDVAKALGAGADAVMVGGLLAGTRETPKGLRGIYRGSASIESYKAQDKVSEWRAAEGVSFSVPNRGPVGDILKELEGCLRSSLSYVGAKNIKEFQENVEFIQITSNSVKEGETHE